MLTRQLSPDGCSKIRTVKTRNFIVATHYNPWCLFVALVGLGVLAGQGRLFTQRDFTSTTNPGANVRPGGTSPSRPLRCQEMSHSHQPSAGALRCHHAACNPPGARSVQSRKYCPQPSLSPSPISS